jgi:hypothetical protein
MMLLHGSTADPAKAWFSYAFGGLCLAIAAASILKGRTAEFFGSVVGLSIFLMSLWYLISELGEGHIFSSTKGTPSIFSAVMFFLIFGLPGILYTRNAKFGLGHRLVDFFDDEYGEFGSSTDEILSREGSTNSLKLLGALIWRLNQKSDAIGYNQLTDVEKKILAIDALEMEVNNGGFDQYFFNSPGDLSQTALIALRDIGALGAAKILDKAINIFPNSEPPQDRSDRQKLMMSLSDKVAPIWEDCDLEFYRLEENIGDLLFAYAKSNRTEIIIRA